MKKYKNYQPLLLAFFSKGLYRDVAKNWRGMGFTYLLLLVSILSIVSAFTYYRGRVAIVEGLQPIIKQIPTIKIQNGIAATDVTFPYLIRSAKSNKTIGIIDTRENPVALESTTAWFMLTKNKFLFKDNPAITRMQNLSVIPNGVYDQPHLQKLITQLSYLIATGLFLMELIFRFCEGVLMILLLGLIAKLLTHTRADYAALCRLAAIAITPGVLLAQVLEIFHLHIPYGALVYFIISLVYLFYGLEANREELDQSTPTELSTECS